MTNSQTDPQETLQALRAALSSLETERKEVLQQLKELATKKASSDAA